MAYLLFILFFPWLNTPADPSPNACELVLVIDNIDHRGGTIWVGVYDSPESFLVKEKARLAGVEVRATGSVTIAFSDLPHGTYAVALFHDQNNNGKLDQNLLGIPTEPYAFSGDLNSRWRLPRFDEVGFRLESGHRLIRCPLHRWRR